MRAIRGGRISIIFQEPMTSLSPLHTIGDQIGEALHLHRKVDAATGRELVIEMLRLVGFPNPAKAPQHLSLRALRRPAPARHDRHGADLPAGAADRRRADHRARRHDPGADPEADQGSAGRARHGAAASSPTTSASSPTWPTEVVVMYHGKVMESGTLDDIFRHPTHPYLQALLRAVPRFDMEPGERLTPLREIPPPSGRMIAAPPAWPAGADAAGPLLAGERHHQALHACAMPAGRAAGTITAVDDVSFEIKRGECLGLVGESGCGKTTLSKMIMRALDARQRQDPVQRPRQTASTCWL